VRDILTNKIHEGICENSQMTISDFSIADIHEVETTLMMREMKIISKLSTTYLKYLKLQNIKTNLKKIYE